MNYYNPVAMLNERTRDGKTDDMGANVRATIREAGEIAQLGQHGLY